MNETILKNAADQYKECILPPFGEFMDMDGFDAICAFSKTFGGSSVYIPSVRTIFKQCIEQDMIRRYCRKRKNIHELVRAYGFSERHIRNVLKNELE